MSTNTSPACVVLHVLFRAMLAWPLCAIISCSSNSTPGGDSAASPPPGSSMLPADDAGSALDAGGDPISRDAATRAPGNRILVSANPNNVLSAFVSFTLPAASTARVVSSSDIDQLVTPALMLAGNGSGQVAVLGLSASTTYSHFVLGTTNGTASLVSDSASLSTAALPPELAPLTFSVTNYKGTPQPGYYLVSGAGQDTFAVDGTGTIRWYRAFGQPTQEAKMQPDGTFTSYVGSSTGSQLAAGKYIRYAPDGTQIAAYAAATPDATEPGMPAVYTDPHELLITADPSGQEHVHLLAYEQRPASEDDSTPFAWHELLRQSTDGTVEFRWKSWSRFTLADQLETDLGGDVDHTNAVAIDPADDNYIVSFRNLDALVKIDSHTGDTIWQLGGKQNQFAIVGDTRGGFQAQHSVRVLANGDLLLYDNGVRYSPPESRAVEYKLDTTKMTATLVWEFHHSPPIYTQVVGSVERLQNGNTLVAFGLAGVVDEVDPQGDVMWEGRLRNAGNAKLAYRIRRLPSVYAYVSP